MKREALAEVLRQIIEGEDIPKPHAVLKVKREDAAKRLPGMPYSMLENLAHTVVWQRFWLAKCHGGPKKSGMAQWSHDWDSPDPSEWNALRSEFLEGLEEAHRIACGAVVEGAEEDVLNALTCLAIHASYHLGQMNLIKRTLRGAG